MKFFYTLIFFLIANLDMWLIPPASEIIRKILSFLASSHQEPAKTVTPVPTKAFGNIDVDAPIKTISRAFVDKLKSCSRLWFITVVPLKNTISHLGSMSFCSSSGSTFPKMPPFFETQRSKINTFLTLPLNILAT